MSNFIISIMIVVALLSAILTNCFLYYSESGKESLCITNSQYVNADSLIYR